MDKRNEAAEMTRNMVEECLKSPDLRTKETAFTRQRKLGAKRILYILLHRLAASLQMAIDRYFNHVGEAPVSKQEFSKARMGLNPEYVRLFYRTKGVLSKTLRKLEEKGLVSRSWKNGNHKWVYFCPAELGIHYNQVHADFDRAQIREILSALEQYCTPRTLRAFTRSSPAASATMRSTTPRRNRDPHISTPDEVGLLAGHAVGCVDPSAVGDGVTAYSDDVLNILWISSAVLPPTKWLYRAFVCSYAELNTGLYTFMLWLFLRQLLWGEISLLQGRDQQFRLFSHFFRKVS